MSRKYPENYMASIVNRNNRSNSSQLSLGTKPIISIQEARKTLGKKASEMTDDDIRALVDSLDEIATLIVRNYKVLKTSQMTS